MARPDAPGHLESIWTSGIALLVEPEVTSSSVNNGGWIRRPEEGGQR